MNAKVAITLTVDASDASDESALTAVSHALDAGLLQDALPFPVVDTVISSHPGVPHLRTPTVHLNGTSKDALVEQLCEACNALHEAQTALGAARPNARDYYPQESGAFADARDRFDELRILVAGIEIRLKEQAERIQDGGARQHERTTNAQET